MCLAHSKHSITVLLLLGYFNDDHYCNDIMTGYPLALGFPESLQTCLGSPLDKTPEKHPSQAAKLHLAESG